MKKQKAKIAVFSAAVAVGTAFINPAQADTSVDTILKAAQSSTTAAQDSQKRIDKLANETQSLLNQFKIVNKEIDGLRVYNTQMEKRIEGQKQLIADLDESIDQVTVIERQIQPLILRMIEALDQFVELDVPLHKDERVKRVQDLRNNHERADISVAEKFRQVLEAYSIESEYGRKIESYPDTLEVDGKERQVNILAIGRIALLYQTEDTKLSGVWDNQERKWRSLSAGEYRSALLQGIKIANQQASIDVMQLPISAPEATQ